MSKVTLVFHRSFSYRGKEIPAGEHTFDLEQEASGFLDKWIRRGCEVKEEKKEAKKEEVKEEEKPKKKARKKKSE